MKDNIFLTGFMGAGKSTVGRCLAKALGYRFADMDQMIVDREGRSIPEIFATEGEAYFRDRESALLNEQIKAERTVFSTGGGIVGREANRMLMKQAGRVVYLRATWLTLQQRLAGGDGRPLADPQKGWETIRQLWESRLPWYEEADVIVDTDQVRVDAVVREIISRLELKVVGQ